MQNSASRLPVSVLLLGEQVRQRGLRQEGHLAARPPSSPERRGLAAPLRQGSRRAGPGAGTPGLPLAGVAEEEAITQVHAGRDLQHPGLAVGRSLAEGQPLRPVDHEFGQPAREIPHRLVAPLVNLASQPAGGIRPGVADDLRRSGQKAPPPNRWLTLSRCGRRQGRAVLSSARRRSGRSPGLRASVCWLARPRTAAG